MYNQFVIFVTFHILEAKVATFRRCGGKCYTCLSVNLVSFITFLTFENLSTVDKVTVYNAMSSFLDHPVGGSTLLSPVSTTRVDGPS